MDERGDVVSAEPTAEGPQHETTDCLHDFGGYQMGTYKGHFYPAAPQPVAEEGPDTGIANLCEALSDKSWLPFPGEGTPKLEEIAAKLADGLTAWREGKGFEDCIGTRDLFAAILRPFITPASSPERVPDGYAYRYHDCIRMNHGEEVNGGKPIEAIPYFLLKPPATPACSTDQAIRYGGALSFKSWLKMHTPLFSHQVNQVVDAHEAFAATPASTGERDADESYAECSDKAVKLLAIIENAVDYEEGCEAVFELRKLLPNIDRYVKDEVADQIEKLSTGEANGWISVPQDLLMELRGVVVGEWTMVPLESDKAKYLHTLWTQIDAIRLAPTSVPQAEPPKCPCIVRGTDGTWEHSGEMQAVVWAGGTLMSCANHLAGYLKDGVGVAAQAEPKGEQ